MLSIGLIILASVFVAPGRASAEPELILDFTGGAPFFSGGNFVFGWRFQTDSPITVDGLGFWDEGGDGLVNPHQVGLWSGDGSSLLVSTTITNASMPVPSTSPDGRWLFNDISPIVLTPSDYVLGASFVSGDADHIRERTIATTIPGVTFVEPRSSNTGGLSFPNMPQPGVADGYFGPNLRIVVPEPASLTLFGLGALAVLGYNWCCKRRRGEDVLVGLDPTVLSPAAILR